MPSGVNFGQQQYSGFEPRMMPGCVMWLDGADSTSLTMSGNVITQWRDKSPNASVGTSVGSPTQTTINGLPAVAFNGSQYFDFGDVANLGLEQYNAFVVAKFNSSNSVGTFFAKSAGPPGPVGNASNRYATYRWSNTNQQPSMASLIQTTVGMGNGEAATTDSRGGRTNLRLFSFSWDRASNNVFVNGLQTGNRSYVDSNVSVTSTYTFLVGAYNSSSGTTPPLAGRYLNGVICELILIFAAITPADFQQVEGYLVEKWKIENPLTLFPVGQGFKYNLPIVRPFQPIDDLTGPVLWLDAADPTTITGSPVTQWRNKSGQGTHATTGLGSVVAGTPINSLNTLRFGLNTTLNISNVRISNTQTSAFYVFRGATTNPNSGAGTGYFIFSRTADNFSVFSGNEQFASYQNPPASRAYVLVMGPGGERNWGNLSTTAFVNRVNVISTTGVDYASSNGLSLPLVGSCNVSNSSFTATTYQISTSRNIGDVFTYELGELIVYAGTASRAVAQQIEGYLAWKWGVRGNLPSTHPYSRVLPSTPQFNPLLLFTLPTSNACLLWFDAADTRMITGTTQVTAWTSKGWRSATAFQGISATNRVGSCTSGSNVNGLNYIRCPAGADLQFTTILPSDQRTWFLVARQVTPLTSGTSTGLVNAFTGGAQDVIKIDYVNATTNNINLGAGTSVRLAANVPAATLSSPFLVSFVNTPSSNSNVLTINGVEQTRTTSTSATGYLNTTSTYLLGTAAYNTTVDLMEVIIYVSNPTPTQRQRMEGYLAWKWGLQSNLPSTHAYAKFRP
jgi:hypothetical protein